MSEPKVIQWGILSTARIATRVCEAIDATKGAQVKVVASRTMERAKHWAAQHGVDQCLDNYEALLADDSLDAIYIPLPPSMHAEWTIRAAEAGKHVLCEKPLAMNVAEAEEMAAACRENNVQLMDATMWVHHPRTAEMYRAITDESFGKLRRVTSAFSFDVEPYLKMKPPHMATNADSGEVLADKIIENELRFQRELGGGALGDLGWYNIRATLWAMGGDLPTRAFATARYKHDVEYNVSAMLWFEGDRMASFDCGYDSARRKWFEITGANQSLVCDDFLNPTTPDRPRYWLHNEQDETTEYISQPLVQEQQMIERFCEIIRSSELDNTWPTTSIANQRVLDAIAKSARTGEVVEI